MKSPLSALFKDRDMALMAILPSALNEWVESALSEYGLPDLLAMAGLGGGSGKSAAGDQAKERERAESRRHAMDPDSIQVSEAHGIAVVRVEGTISPYYYNSVDPRGLASTVRALGANPLIRTVILDLDSPGGHAVYVRELGSAIREVGDQGTRTIAHIGPGAMAASAAYWIAASADEIHASTAGMVGSIGVFSALYEFSGMLGKLGISLKLFRDGPLKGMGIFGKSLTDDEAAHVQAGVDKVSAEFKGFIRARRPGIAEETMHGQVFDGDESITARLIDGHVEDLAELVAMEIERSAL